MVPAYLASKLKPHLMDGLRFLWRCLYAEHEVRMTTEAILLQHSCNNAWVCAMGMEVAWTCSAVA